MTLFHVYPVPFPTFLTSCSFVHICIEKWCALPHGHGFESRGGSFNLISSSLLDHLNIFCFRKTFIVRGLINSVSTFLTKLNILTSPNDLMLHFVFLYRVS